MRAELFGVEARRQRLRALRRRINDGRRAAAAAEDLLDQRQRHLAAADQLEIDVGENLAVEQRAMQRAPGIVDAVMLAERVETDAGAGMLFARQSHGVDHGIGKARAAHLLEFVVEKAHIERRVVGDQRRVAEEGHHVVGDLGKARLVAQELVAEAMDTKRFLGHRPLGVKVFVEVPAGRNVVDQFDRTDLDHPVPGQGVEAGGFGIEDDFAAHRCPWVNWSTSSATRCLVSESGPSVSTI